MGSCPTAGSPRASRGARGGPLRWGNRGCLTCRSWSRGMRRARVTDFISPPRAVATSRATTTMMSAPSSFFSTVPRCSSTSASRPTPPRPSVHNTTRSGRCSLSVTTCRWSTAPDRNLAQCSPPPAAAAIDRWTRTLRLERGQKIVITGDYQLRESRAPGAFHFITQIAPAVTAPGTLGLQTPTGIPAWRHYDADRLEAKLGTKEITDALLAASWGASVHRILLPEKKALTPARYEFHLTRPPTTPTR